MTDTSHTEGRLDGYLHAAESAAMMVQTMTNHAFSARHAAKGIDVSRAREVAARLQSAAETLRMVGEPAIVKTEDAA